MHLEVYIKKYFNLKTHNHLTSMLELIFQLKRKEKLEVSFFQFTFISLLVDIVDWV